MPTPAPHPLLDRDSKVQALVKAGTDTPWRKRSRLQGEFGLEQVFEHPGSRTWVKILEDHWGERIVAIVRRQQDLPTSQQFVTQEIQRQGQGYPPNYSTKLVDSLTPTLEPDLQKQALASKWVDAWEGVEYSTDLKWSRPIKTLIKEIPVAMANQFKFGILIEEHDTSIRSQAFFQNAFQNMIMQQMGGNNFLKVRARLVFAHGNTSASSFDDEDEYYDESGIGEAIQVMLPRFTNHDAGCSEEGDAYVLFEKALGQGFIWDEQLQERLDNQVREHTGHLTPGGERIESALERAKLRNMLDTQIPAAPKKRL